VSISGLTTLEKSNAFGDRDDNGVCKTNRTVTLDTNDALTKIGTMILKSDFQETPLVLIWKGRIFVSGALYGQEGYNEASHLELAEDAVSTSKAAT
jgi:hypothetical protein